jgi:hypothetical protein
MFNFFEQPWTLFITAFAVLYAIFRFRSIFPNKRHWWQWLIPVFIAVSAFGLDWIVQTDFEKINILVATGIKGVEEEDADAIEGIVSADYRDSFHYNRERLRAHCERELTHSLVEECKKLFLQLDITPPTATADLTVLVKFEEDSYVAQNYKQSVVVRVKLHLQKEQDKKWFINRIEMLAIDNRPVNWRQIR